MKVSRTLVQLGIRTAVRRDRRVCSPACLSKAGRIHRTMMLDQGYGDGNLALRLNQLKFIYARRQHDLDTKCTAPQ